MGTVEKVNVCFAQQSSLKIPALLNE